MMKLSTFLKTWAICVMAGLPCAAFVTATNGVSPVVDAGDTKRSSLPPARTFNSKRGGIFRSRVETKSISDVSSTQLEALPLQDFSGPAAGLFGNLLGPASMIAGGLVPLGFLAEPLPGNKSFQKRLRSIYFMIAVVSLANELLAIMYATVASNKLVETVVAPSASVFALLQRDYELPWIGTNVHFMMGLLGFMAMVGIRAYAFLPVQIHKPAAGLAGSCFLAMVSIVNRGIAQGDNTGQFFGRSVISLTIRYIALLYRQICESGGPLAVVALVLGVLSSVLCLRALSSPELG